jgi:hypothetical protein
MREGEETGEGVPAAAAEASSPSGGGSGSPRPTLGERRGLLPGALRVHTGADGAYLYSMSVESSRAGSSRIEAP